MNLWKLQARNPEYDPDLPVSGPVEWFVHCPHPVISSEAEALALASEKKARDGLDWDAVPL